MAVFLLVLKILGITLACVVALAGLVLALPLNIAVDYKKEIVLYVRVLFVRYTVYPEKKKKPSAKKGISEYERDVTNLIKPISTALSHILRKIELRRVKIVFPVENDDPAKLAINYGRINAIFGCLLAFLQNILIIDIDEYRIIPDFERRFADQTHIHLELRAAIFRLLVALVLFAQRLNEQRQNEGDTK